MKYLKFFENHQSEEEIDKICNKYGIENWSINNDGTVDVDGDVNLKTFYSVEKLTKIPLKFGNVTGDFSCYYNKLTSLEGCPQSVGGSFNCSNNKLTSLEGSPQSVGRDFYSHHNQLTSLEGCPKSVGGGFDCSNNPFYNIWKLISLDYKLDYQIIELLNDYDCLRDTNIIIDRFNDFLKEIGKPPVESVEGYNNI